MLSVDWTIDGGWQAPAIIPYGDVSISPASQCLHYALQCFEGMKAYVDANGDIRLFRPDQNMKRMNRSMARLHLPTFDGDEMLACLKELVKMEKDWIPHGEGYSLYIRPTGISTTPAISVGPPKAARVMIILSPVGPYYPTGFAPVDLYADSKNVRAFPGGVGDTKVGGNYGPTIRPQMEAAAKGYSQVLWLFGDEHYVTEVGTMNLFFLWENKETGRRELITAPLDGTILPGVTRDSILHLARSGEFGEMDVTERSFTIHDVIEAVNEGRVVEAFGAGTAAIVSPVRSFNFDGTDYQVPLDASDADASAGPLTKQVSDTIQGIQYGTVEGPEGWSVVVK
jgi:branched-chain amino acid aminotransferase